MRNLIRTKWAAVGAAVAVTLGAGGVSLTQAAISSGEKPVVITVDTTRILDTRTGVGLAGGRLVDSTPRDLQVTGDVPIAPSGTATVVPAGAIGVLVNVTVVSPNSKGFLSLRSGGAAGTPATSTVNFEAGITTPNAATVDLSGDGKLQIWLETDNDGGSAHVLLDVVGYTVDHDHNDLYYTKTEVDAATLFATVAPATPAAAVLRGRGATAVTRLSQGFYSVTFDRDVSGCTWNATYGEPATAGVDAKFATVRGANSAPNQVGVVIWDAAGAQADGDGFHLVVNCP